MEPALAVPAASSTRAEFVCPRCKGELAANSTSYRCDRCAITYPVLFGIPDFRLRSDRYLSLEDERAKARLLYEFGQTFAASVIVGFATTLFLGVAISMFTAIVISRTLLRVVVRSNTSYNHSLFGAGLENVPPVAGAARSAEVS